MGRKSSLSPRKTVLADALVHACASNLSTCLSIVLILILLVLAYLLFRFATVNLNLNINSHSTYVERREGWPIIQPFG